MNKSSIAKRTGFGLISFTTVIALNFGSAVNAQNKPLLEPNPANSQKQQELVNKVTDPDCVLVPSEGEGYVEQFLKESCKIGVFAYPIYENASRDADQFVVDLGDGTVMVIVLNGSIGADGTPLNFDSIGRFRVRQPGEDRAKPYMGYILKQPKKIRNKMVDIFKDIVGLDPVYKQD